MQKPEVINAQSSIKYDVDYTDEGVHVIIPKMLPETKVKAGGRLTYSVSGYSGPVSKALNDSVANSYIATGFEAAPPNLFKLNGTEYSQVLAFSGNAEGLDNLNNNYTKAKIRDTVLTTVGHVTGAVAGFFIGRSVGENFGAGNFGATVGTTSGLSGGGNVNIKNAKSAVFDGYQSIAAKDTDKIEIYGVSTQGDKYQGNIVFITEKAEVDDAVIIRGIIKAQNITKLSE